MGPDCMIQFQIRKILNFAEQILTIEPDLLHWLCTNYIGKCYKTKLMLIKAPHTILLEYSTKTSKYHNNIPYQSKAVRK